MLLQRAARLQPRGLRVFAERREDPARSRKGKSFENSNRRRGRPAWKRSPYDSPLRDGNRDRLIGLLTERAAKTLMVYLMELNPIHYSWLVEFYKENPIPKVGSWDDVSGEAFLRKLLSMPIEEASFRTGTEALFSNSRVMGVDPRNLAMRILDIRSQLAGEFVSDLEEIAEENNSLLRETLNSSLGKKTLEGRAPGESDASAAAEAAAAAGVPLHPEMAEAVAAEAAAAEAAAAEAAAAEAAAAEAAAAEATAAEAAAVEMAAAAEAAQAEAAAAMAAAAEAWAAEDAAAAAAAAAQAAAAEAEAAPQYSEEPQLEVAAAADDKGAGGDAGAALDAPSQQHADPFVVAAGSEGPAAVIQAADPEQPQLQEEEEEEPAPSVAATDAAIAPGWAEALPADDAAAGAAAAEEAPQPVWASADAGLAAAPAADEPQWAPTAEEDGEEDGAPELLQPEAVGDADAAPPLDGALPDGPEAGGARELVEASADAAAAVGVISAADAERALAEQEPLPEPAPARAEVEELSADCAVSAVVDGGRGGGAAADDTPCDVSGAGGPRDKAALVAALVAAFHAKLPEHPSNAAHPELQGLRPDERAN
ncbi:hypothetical protein Rsub_02570 [Raphidocelis subcapitata]|uniref:Uncharacterized protein n=1 Tax=Raphidocelis subcapitata TaxID=307507 RepID=A0A2V0NQF2_9CHLO|nr:hypothetical protein Rsub_02570 [Raphidocelis subcapitata]|eukprot:GBF89866.1 hypothetical protein Rsub_02570 [Raphidocelis subcapitata]